MGKYTTAFYTADHKLYFVGDNRTEAILQFPAGFGTSTQCQKRLDYEAFEGLEFPLGEARHKQGGKG